MKNGVPFDVAMSLEEDDALGYMIIFGQLDGNEWNWDEMRWIERR